MSGYYDPGQHNSNWGTFDPGASAHSWDPVPLSPGFSRLGQVVRLALRLLGVLTVVQVVLYAWGLSMFDDAVARGDLGQLRQYDNADRAIGVSVFVLLLVAGITWMVWQQKLARSASPVELRRRPGWHAWGWITPFVALWFPYQNVHDLWRRRFPDRGAALLGWWWAAYLVSNFLDQLIVRGLGNGDSIDELKTQVRVELVSDLIGLVALVMAVRIHRSLSDAELWRFRPPLTPPASPAG